MPKRRPNGDGMVRKRPDGRWEGRIIVGKKSDDTYIYRSVFDTTQKGLVKKLHALIEEYEGKNINEKSSITLAEWLDMWLENYIKPNVRENTIKAYTNMINGHINPALGNTVIKRLNTNTIQKFYSNLKKKNLSDNYIRKIHTMLRQALESAKSEHLLSSNPTDNCKIPKADRTAKRILTDKELEIFMQAIRADNLWYDFFYLEISTGLRKGEICALKWSDYNEENKSLTIQRSVSTKKSSGLIIGETKTDKSKRTIFLPDNVNDMLKSRKQTSYSEWIFPNLLQYDQPTNPQTAYRNMKKILDKAGLPSIRFHDLRHTFATHALTNNVDPKTLSNILGHTNTSFTLDTYTHVTTDMQEKASGIIGNVFSDVIKEVNCNAGTQT